MINIHSLGGNQDTWEINEYGLYNLVFMSKKPEAESFKKGLLMKYPLLSENMELI
ncbi:BRO family protein [Bacillus cereus group sp. TH230-1LC]|nr:BRO family protein [Bacillus cereus group sp. TH230-1LC]